MNHPFLKTELGSSPVVVEAEFKASCDRLFQAWTKPEEVKQWFGAAEGGPETAEIDLKIGGHWRFVFAENEGQTDSLGGTYLTIEPAKELVFSWIHTRILSDGSEEVSPESIVTVSFESLGMVSRVRILHESISTEGARVNIGGGWDACLQKIKPLVEA